MSKGFFYITPSKDGIWYYQRWIPKRLSTSQESPIGKLFRVSLRTKDKNNALRLSRRLSVKIDELITEHFHNPEQFAQAMKTLYIAIKAGGSLEGHEELGLNDYDDYLLGKANRLTNRVQLEVEKLQTEINFLREALLHNTGKSSLDNKELIKQINETLNPPLPDEKNPTFWELFDKWQDNQKKNLVKTSFEGAFKPAIKLFIRFINEFEGEKLRAKGLNAEHIRFYQKHYPKIPVRLQTEKYTIGEIIQQQGRPKSPSTISLNYSFVSTFLNWVEAQGYPIDSRAQKVLTKGSGIKKTRKTTKQRVPFSDDDLKSLFNSEQYMKTGAFRTSGMYWAPLISLFTGARMSEILQLNKCDIRKDSGVYFFSFDDAEGSEHESQKHIKTESSKRLVPIHNVLVNLDFLGYVNKCESRIFPDEPRNHNNKFDAFQKRHTTYRKKTNVMPSNSMEYKDFHSFRHTVRTRLSELSTTGRSTERFDEGIIDSILGHKSNKRSMGEKVYNHFQYLKIKSMALQRLKYDFINFEEIINWKMCTFERQKHRKNLILR